MHKQITENTNIIGSDSIIIPVFRCTSLVETFKFYTALGFEVTHEQTKPYTWGAVRLEFVEIDFHGTRKLNPEHASSCIVMVNNVETPYQTFVKGLRRAYKGLPVSGIPRITRFRKGHTRFTLYDPDGNTVLFIAKDEPPIDYEQGWGEGKSKLMQVLENANFLRDTYHNDRTAAKLLDKVLLESGSNIPVELARVIAARAELAIALGEREKADELREQLQKVQLTPEERETYHEELNAADWLGEMIAWEK